MGAAELVYSALSLMDVVGCPSSQTFPSQQATVLGYLQTNRLPAHASARMVDRPVSKAGKTHLRKAEDPGETGLHPTKSWLEMHL